MYNSTRSGFTLIEVLVVLVILGLCAGLVKVLAQPDERTMLGLEAERLAQGFDLAATEARLTATRISWSSDGSGYSFQRHVDGGVFPELRAENRADQPLRERRLPAGMVISDLRVENTRSRSLRLDFAPHAPPLPFAVQVSMGADQYVIAGSATGEVRVQSSGGPADAGTATR